MAHYWKQEQQELIKRYYYCQYEPDSGITRNRCITELLPVLEHMIRLSLYTTGCISPTSENIQDVLVHLIDNVLPRLKEQYIQGALNYIWVSCRRYLINQRTALKPYFTTIDDDVDVVSSKTYEADYLTDKADLRKEILEALDEKIEHLKQINKTSTLMLILMKEYLIENDFNPEGFNVYVQERMNILPSTYAGVINRCGIRSKIFNQKIIDTNNDNKTE